ncbi:MAG: phosphotransferase [Janthinobacterium lividum]
MNPASAFAPPTLAVRDTLSADAATDWAGTLLARHWRLHGALLRLAGERDRNFLLTQQTAAGVAQRFILKISHPAEDTVITDFQTQALLHIARADPSLPVQRIVPTQEGAASFPAQAPDGSMRMVRLLAYLDGEPLPNARRSPAQSDAIARLLARLDLALRDFRHPAGALELPWDIQHTDSVTALLDEIADPERRASAQRVLGRFVTHVKPRLPALRAQPIHNDFNIFNLLVAPDDHDRIAGILDFGDMVHAPLIDDLAVAAAYQLDAREDGEGGGDGGGKLLASLCRFAAAYHAVLPLQTRELDLLFDLVQARLLMIVAISAWRAAREPHNASYLLRNNAVSWTRLSACAAIDHAQASAALRTACRVV